MIVDRYYYSQLNKREQAIYKAFYDGVQSHKDIIPIPVKGIFTQNMFTRIFMAITRDNPLIYYLNQSACNMATDAFGRSAICPQYFFSKEKVSEYNKKIESAVNGLVEQLNLTEGSDYDKTIKVHDWFCENISYDEKGKDVNDPVRLIASHNIIGVFAHHKAQCEGIAKAVKVLLNTVDVRCIVATGDACSERENGPHAWNIVKLDNTPYHIDVTWDIGSVTSANYKNSYDYFNVSDDIISIDHKAYDELPKCKSLELNYFTKNKLVFNSKIQLLAYIGKALASGKTEFYFRVEGKLNQVEAIKEVNQVISAFMAGKGKNSIRFQHMVNDVVRTCYVKFL